MNSIIRLLAGVNRVNCANPKDCLEEVLSLIEEHAAEGFDIAVFPRLALCSPSCGALFSNAGFLDQCVEALDTLAAATRETDGYLLVGTVATARGEPVVATALLHHGEIVALIPAEDAPPPFPPGQLPAPFVAPGTVFSCGKLRFSVLSCDLNRLSLSGARAVEAGCDLLLVPAYTPIRAGFYDECRQSARQLSQAAGCAVAVVNGGIGDTSSPWLYQGFCAIYECGAELGLQRGEQHSFALCADLDSDIIQSQKRFPCRQDSFAAIQSGRSRPRLLRPVDRNPFLPKEGKEAYLEDLFHCQVRSLAARMENIGCTKLVIGVSGGLDSTAALLVAAAATDWLGLPRESITGVTMPGLGTSDRTYFNALCLLEALGVSRKDISIRPSVQQHFEDIGHSGAKDVTYENAQARERAQILLDLANMLSGLVVGTGDLSEEALGFCTFAGDHISNYNVNTCITKTVLRELVSHIGRMDLLPGVGVGEILQDILDTPISPELLPPGESGDIEQKTEEILGPYELHDFFLYYFLRYRLRPTKLYYYACIAFAGALEPSYIKEKLRLFWGRFCAGQFKRACAPDCAAITQVNLCNHQFYIPSDLDPSTLLREIEQINF